jgi:mxaJ protein
MCSRFPSAACIFTLILGSALTAHASGRGKPRPYTTVPAQASVLRVCADPNNLPFSNTKRHGFENHIAELVAKSLGKKIEYKWIRFSGRGFVRNVLNEKECDLLPSVPVGFKLVLTTAPYYRSGFVFVTRADRELAVTNFDDPKLKPLKIGMQVVEEEYAPPALALGKRGMVANIVGYEAIGADASSIVDAVAQGKVDASIVWGPLAGFYARRRGRQLRITHAPESDGPNLPLAFSIAMGLRKDDAGLRDQINEVLQAHATEIRKILEQYSVPLLPLDTRQEFARR